MNWRKVHPKACPEMLGFIPSFLSGADPRPAREQLDANYSHGGGWSPFSGFKMLPSGDIQYPDDDVTHCLYEAKLRFEVVRVYEHAWVAIIQANGEFEISRMD